VSISSLSKGRTTLLKGFDHLSGNGHDESKPRNPKGKEIRTPRPTARDLIFDSGNVGVDLRDQTSTKAAPPVFIKPAGVDDPKGFGEAASSAEKIPSEAPIIDGARQKSKKTKRERDQDEVDDDGEPVEKKSKKKKKSSASRG